MSRRRALGLLTAGVGATGVVAAGGWQATHRARPTVSGPTVARRPLTIPTAAPSTVGADGVRRFRLIATGDGTTDLGRGRQTPTWGFNGPYGGPTLRARRGETVQVEVVNRLSETTTVHWHGMSVPARADGGPHQPIAPATTWSPSWRIDQPAATLWYHPHHHGSTERHVYRGLHGFFIVDDPTDRALDGDCAGPGLPTRYGIDDIPLAVTDRSFTADGTLDEQTRTAHGLLGDTVLVNGTPDAVFEARHTRLRLRLLNASTARSYRFVLDGARSLELVATDTGMLPRAVPIEGVTLTPGERAEVLCELRPATTATLRSVPHDLGLLASTARSAGTTDTFTVLEIDTVAQLVPAPAPGPVLARTPVLPPPATTRALRLDDNTINGRTMDLARIDEVVTAGAVELWQVTNGHHLPHNLHIHDARFLVRDIDGASPPAELSGWKDTAYIPPRRTVSLHVRFGRHSDPHSPYMFHCHLLQHEDLGMMGQFVSVEPGTVAGPVRSPALDPITGVGHGP